MYFPLLHSFCIDFCMSSVCNKVINFWRCTLFRNNTVEAGRMAEQREPHNQQTDRGRAAMAETRGGPVGAFPTGCCFYTSVHCPAIALSSYYTWSHMLELKSRQGRQYS